MSANRVKIRLHLIVISHGKIAHWGELVHKLALIHHFVHSIHDEVRVRIDFLDERHVVSTQLLRLFCRESTENLAHIVHQHALIFGCNGNNMIHTKVAQYAAFDLHLFIIDLPFNLVASSEFVACHHVHTLKHFDAWLIKIAIEDNGAARFAVQATAERLLLPFFRITITVKKNGATNFNVLAENCENGFRALSPLSNQRIHASFEVAQSLCHGSIQHNHSRRAVGARTQCAEFKAVTHESEGRSSVAVRIVYENFGNLWDIQLHPLFSAHSRKFVRTRISHGVYQFAQFLT